MRIILFIMLIFVFYILLIMMYKKYHGKKLLIYYLVCLLGACIMYTLSLVLAVRYGTEMMDVCHDFYHSILVIIMVGLNIIIMETLVNFLIKVMMSFHVKYNGLVMNEEPIQVIDKFKSLFIKWGRFIYLTGCIILIVGCMFS